METYKKRDIDEEKEVSANVNTRKGKIVRLIISG